ncbi:hypothetical protein CNMCM8812_001257 [Aspergillus fumigatus]|nr:hypothetical protein CNMCM8812_001257 [Aspergillus fumigatus]
MPRRKTHNHRLPGCRAPDSNPPYGTSRVLIQDARFGGYTYEEALKDDGAVFLERVIACAYGKVDVH